MREWTRRVSEYYEEGFYTLPLNSEIPEETKFYFAGERVLMRSMFNSPFTNIQVGFLIDLILFPHLIKSQVLEKSSKVGDRRKGPFQNHPKHPFTWNVA